MTDDCPDAVLPSALQSLVERTATLLDADVVAVLLAEPADDRLTLAAVAGDSPSRPGDRVPMRAGSAVLRALSGGLPADLGPATGSSTVGDTDRSLAVPIRLAGRAVGAIEAARSSVRPPFDVDRVVHLEAFAETAGLILANRQLAQQEKGRRERAAALLEIARATTSTLELNEVLEQVVQTITRLTGADRCSIWLLDARTQRLTTAAISGIDPTFAATWRRRSFRLEEEQLSKHVLETGEALPVYDAETHPLTDKQAVRFFGDKSILVVPLICRGDALGTLFLNHIHRYHQFPTEEIEFTLTLAGHAAVAIHNAQLYAQARETGELLRWSMRQLGSLAPNASLDEVLECIVAVAAELLQVPYCGIRLLDERTQELVFRATRGIPRDLIERSRIKVGEGVSGQVVLQGAPIWVEDLWSDPRRVLTAFVEAAGLRGFLGVPLLAKGRAVGVLSAYTPYPYRFTQDQVDLLSSFANQAAIAIENATLLAETMRRAQEFALLHAASTALNSSLDLRQVLTVIGRSAQQMARADRTVIFLLDDKTGEVERVVDLPFERGTVRERPRPGGLTLRVLRTGTMEIIDDVTSDPSVRPELVAEGIRSTLGMPLKVDDRIVGLIWLNSTHRSHFTSDHTELLSVLANHIAAVLKNAWLYDNAVQEKEKFAAIFKNSNDGILLVDPTPQVVDLNPAMERMLAWQADEARGRPCSEVLGCRRRQGEDPCREECMLRRAFAGASSGPYLEATAVARDDREIEIAASFSQIPSPDGGPPFGVCIVRDVTEARRVEAAKSDFVSMVSHELRTPLSLVKGYASTLLRDDLTFDADTQRRFVRNIDEAANRLTRLINDLLSVSRLELGRFELRARDVDLRELVGHSLREGSWLSTHRLEVVLPPAPLRVRVDLDRIEQVLHNLLRNAAMYSQAGTPLRVLVDRGDHVGALARLPVDGEPGWRQFAPAPLPVDGSWAVVRVVDRGVGLAEEDMRRVFEKFYRVDRGLEAKTSGMGIGLFLARGLVEAHGGRIWVQSARGRGCAFGFCLPLAAGGGD
ncbi:MAG: GAF domain-containing protein [Chloroflexi bacterium]|nr:GAF domain-containing protein [Chloroflexota bacterium]